MSKIIVASPAAVALQRHHSVACGRSRLLAPTALCLSHAWSSVRCALCELARNARCNGRSTTTTSHQSLVFCCTGVEQCCSSINTPLCSAPLRPTCSRPTVRMSRSRCKITMVIYLQDQFCNRYKDQLLERCLSITESAHSWGF